MRQKRSATSPLSLRDFLVLLACLLLWGKYSASLARCAAQSSPPTQSAAPTATAAQTVATAENHYQTGNDYFYKSDWDHAITEYCQAFRLDPNLNATRLNLARAFEADGDWAGAAAIYRKALLSAPASAALRESLATAMVNSGDVEGGVHELQKLILLDPGNAVAHRELGIALGKAGDWDGEIAEEKKAIEISPTDDKAHLAFSNALARKADWHGALAEMQKAAELQPQNAAYAAGLGRFYEMMGKKAEALREYQKAVTLAPKNQSYHDLYAGLEQALGSAVSPNGLPSAKPEKHRKKRAFAVPLYTPEPPNTKNQLPPNLLEDLSVQFQVGKDGGTSRVSIVGKGAGAAINAVAIATVRTWKFRPTMRKGVPVSSIFHAALRVDTRKPFWSMIGNHDGGCQAHLLGGAPVYTFSGSKQLMKGQYPRSVYTPDPPYSPEARMAKYQANVLLEILVKYDGSVAEARVVKPAGFGLDEEALKTILTWKFKPAVVNGAPVNAMMYVDVSYRIRF
ncbi:MAG: TonB family protein [Acidobacteriota bacterium]|nr:TonB family protein [Acidobacteriota bacterium]